MKATAEATYIQGKSNHTATGGDQEKLHNTSPFKATICHEDIQHIKAIEAINVDTTPPQRLVDVLYRAMTKPVQGNFHWELSLVKFI